MEEKITKLKVVEDQLLLATKLFFKDEHSVSMHILTHASHEILEFLCKDRGIEGGVISEGVYKYIKEENLKEVRDKIFESKNYFKHAKDDPDAILSWNPSVTKYFIWDSISLYKKLEGKYNKVEFFIFSAWFRIHHDDLWNNSASIEKLLPGVKNIKSYNKQDFYKIAMSSFENERLPSDL